jgi:hypothetical protein
MENIDLLLTDEFVEFSTQIKSIHVAKTDKTKEFKALYTKFQQECAELDKRAKELQDAWEEWKVGAAKQPKKTVDHK